MKSRLSLHSFMEDPETDSFPYANNENEKEKEKLTISEEMSASDKDKLIEKIEELSSENTRCESSFSKPRSSFSF